MYLCFSYLPPPPACYHLLLWRRFFSSSYPWLSYASIKSSTAMDSTEELGALTKLWRSNILVLWLRPEFFRVVWEENFQFLNFSWDPASNKMFRLASRQTKYFFRGVFPLLSILNSGEGSKEMLIIHNKPTDSLLSEVFTSSANEKWLCKELVFACRGFMVGSSSAGGL